MQSDTVLQQLTVCVFQMDVQLDTKLDLSAICQLVWLY